MEVKIKADKLVIIVSAVVGLFGFLGAILGFAAEGAHETTVGLGICAAIFLLAAQITVTVAGVHFKARAVPSENKRIIGIVCGVVSWVLAVMAFVLLLRGAFNTYTSYVGGVSAGGGVVTLVATALGITSFIMLRGQPADAGAANKSGEQPAYASTANKPGEQPSPDVTAMA